MKDETLLVTAGRDPRADYGAVNTPAYRTSTILFESFDEFEAALHDPVRRKFAYGRLGTPTSAALEDAVSQLEGGARSRLAPSGLAAITTALTAFLSAGDHLLMTQGAYPPARRFCEAALTRMGIETTYYDPLIGADIDSLFRPNTKLVYVESPSSGLFDVQDIPAIARVAHDRGAIVVMDNTWASPLYFKPFAHGVDVSIQAATKYIVGHSDAMLGVITCSEQTWRALRSTHREWGQTAGPDDIYLGLRGIRTLAVRLKQHHENGITLAHFLNKRSEVERVYHPALEGDPGHSLWKRDFLGASGLFAVQLKSWVTRRALAAMLDGLKLFGMGYSWGGYESLAAPFHLSHYRPGLTGDDPWLIRIHAGLEDRQDLTEDLAQGFQRLNANL